MDHVRGIGIFYYWLLIIQYPASLEPALAAEPSKVGPTPCRLSYAAPIKMARLLFSFFIIIPNPDIF